ncbi:hypothetical protein BDN72DRAFT_903850 [Pluteus cervinus]|uniref:Uncharacterized protein n=1 Tax=Pluteus cervinus TaxID=181527 RepID=A0ACD3A7W4_9AGAR|nr:hypothetical protein BDN72DRAFT_903850 [Pluteus cervinus]
MWLYDPPRFINQSDNDGKKAFVEYLTPYARWARRLRKEKLFLVLALPLWKDRFPVKLRDRFPEEKKLELIAFDEDCFRARIFWACFNADQKGLKIAAGIVPWEEIVKMLTVEEDRKRRLKSWEFEAYWGTILSAPQYDSLVPDALRVDLSRPYSVRAKEKNDAWEAREAEKQRRRNLRRQDSLEEFILGCQM